MRHARSLALTSSRCALRPLSPRDAGRLHALFTNPGVRQFLWDGEVIPIERTHDVVARSAAMFRDHCYGLWAARMSGARGLSGFAGFWWFRDPPELELLYGVDERLWGRGLATEIAQVVVAYGFDDLQMRTIRASTDTANVASIRVLEKLGFRFVARGMSGGLDTAFYELLRARVPAWRGGHPADATQISSAASSPRRSR